MSFDAHRYTLEEMLRGVPYVGTAKKLGYNLCAFTAPNGDKVVRHCLTNIVTLTPEGNYIITSGPHPPVRYPWHCLRVTFRLGALGTSCLGPHTERHGGVHIWRKLGNV